MSAEFLQIWPFLIAVLAVFMIYRRFRRSFGRQPVRPLRMVLRMALLIALGVSLLPLSLHSGEFQLVQIIGAAVGVSFGLWAAHRTRYTRDEGHLYYLPHTYAGIAIFLLVLGRLVYRVIEVYAGSHSPQAFAAPAMVRSPATVGLFFVLIGYYVCYYGCVLWKSKHLRTEDLQASSGGAPKYDAAR
jgi:hypothetical protein